MLEKTLKMVNQNIWYLGLAAFASFSLISAQDFPYLGLSLSIAALATIVFGLKEQKSRLIEALYILTLVFAFFIAYRANELLTFLNLLAALTCGSLLSRVSANDDDLGFVDALASPFFTVVTSIFSTSYRYQVQPVSKGIKLPALKNVQWTSLIQSGVVSVVILAIILPLLASANPIFDSWLQQVIKVLNLSFLSDLFTDWNWNIVTWRLIFLAFFAYFIPRLVNFANTHYPYLKQSPLQSIPLLIPQVLVAIVVGIFFLSQAQLYFASPESLVAMGYTHSEQTREIFGQLSVVGFIMLLLMYNQTDRKPAARWLTLVLLVETIFLSLIALKSVGDYSLAWGLTHKRLWGFTAVVWIFGLISSFGFWYFKQLANTIFVKSIVLWTAFILVGVNLLNFDALVNRFPPSEVKGTVDTEYLAFLSPDAHSYQEQVTRLQAEPIAAQSFDQLAARLYQLRAIAMRTTRLKEKYSDLDWRTFNFSEYWEYLDTKELNLSAPIQELEAEELRRIEKNASPVVQPASSVQ